MSEIQLSSIRVEDRLREDLGELGELMASIQQYGLLHPIVIDDKRRLIAGHRRLEASRRLGKKRIEVKLLGELSAEERREIELEENVQRKDLTPYERSKNIAERAEAAKERAQQELVANAATKDRVRGRPKEASTKQAAEKTGIPRRTIGVAEEHVSAGEKYPFLQDRRWSQRAALDMAKLLDDIGEKDVEYLFEFCTNGYGGAPKTIRAFFETWHGASPALKEKLKKRLAGHRQESSRTVSVMAKCAPNPDPALVWTSGACRELKSMLSKRPKGDGLISALRDCLAAVERFRELADGHNKKSIEELRKELLS